MSRISGKLVVAAVVIAVALAGVWFWQTRAPASRSGTEVPAPERSIASVEGNWLFLPKSSNYNDGIYFDGKDRYARWGREAEGGFSSPGKYSQSDTTLTFTNEFTYWPDGEEMKGKAEILVLTDEQLELKTPKGTFKLKKLPATK